MSKENERKIEILKMLAEGCHKHPAYRARRPTTGRCEECVVVWTVRLELRDMSVRQMEGLGRPRVCLPENLQRQQRKKL